VNREVVLGGVTDRGGDIDNGSRPDDTQRAQLVDAGIGGVELREEIVTANFALQKAAQVFLDSLLILIHRL
jgi:hypothetical protein